MFEIHGIFSENDIKRIDRLSQNLTLFYINSTTEIKSEKIYKGKLFNLCNNFADFKNNIYALNKCTQHKTVILPPVTKVVEIYSKICDRIIITFNGLENLKPPIHPNVTLSELSNTLENLESYKEKCLIQLSGNCYDYVMSNHSKSILTNNQAVLKALVHSSEICYDEESGNSYFTYLGENLTPHFVWIEDTKSLSVKHNLIKDKGFRGICWENPYVLSEGNWESMYMAYQKI